MRFTPVLPFLVLVLAGPGWAQTRPAVPEARLPGNSDTGRSHAVLKALDKGLQFLVDWQSPNGSWDRLENPDPIQIPDPERAKRVVRGEDFADGIVKDLADKETEHVADTCLSGLALLEGWKSANRTKYAKNLLKTTDFICKQVDKWDNGSIYIQKRIFDPLHDQTPAAGADKALEEFRFYDPTVDTFFALWFLSEVRGKFSDKESNDRVDATLDKLMTKIERCQDTKGTWVDDSNPWRELHHKLDESKVPALAGAGGSGPGVREAPQKVAPNLNTHAIATGALNVAARRGVPYAEETLRKADLYTKNLLDKIGSDEESMASALFAVYQAELTNTTMIEATRLKAEKSPNEAARKVLEAKLPALNRRGESLRGQKEILVRSLLARWKKKLPDPVGVKMAIFPTLIDAVADVDPAFARQLAAHVVDTLLSQQNGTDGHFTYGDIRQRGDNTYATAAALLILFRHPYVAGRP